MDLMLLVRQILTATKANLLVRYRQSWAGFLWVTLNPILTLVAQTFVFKYVLNVAIPNYTVYLFSGLLPWIFISSSMEMTAMVLIYQGRVIKSYQLSPLVFIGAQVLDNFLSFVIVFILVSLWAVFGGHLEVWNIFFAIVATLPLMLGTLGISFFFAVLTPFYRDVKFIMSFALTIIFFITPIFFDEKMVPEAWKFLVLFNPLYHLVRPIREAMLATSITSDYYTGLASGFGVAFIFMLLGMGNWYIRRNEVKLFV